MLTTEATVAAWLAKAHQSSLRAEIEWTAHHIAMLPLGRRFDAVRMPPEIVQAAAGSDDWTAITEYLANTLDGPVIYDPSSWVYALVPPRTTETWRSPHARCVGRGSWLGVPRTDRTEVTFGPYWAVQMRSVGALCLPDAVAALVSHGHRALTGVTR